MTMLMMEEWKDTNNSNEDDTTATIRKEWEHYKQNVMKYKQRLLLDPSSFSIPFDEMYFRICQKIPLPLPIEQRLPQIRIPIRILIVNNTSQIECSNDINETSIRDVLRVVNDICWKVQANIIFYLLDDRVEYVSLQDHLSVQEHTNLINTIYNNNKQRNPRRDRVNGVHPFQDIVQPCLWEHYVSKKSPSTITLCFVDCIGNTLQGICLPNREKYNNNRSSANETTINNSASVDDATRIKRPNKNKPFIFIGERSNKGYLTLTKRPLIPCVSKTIGHELGHALSLQHIRGRVFSCSDNNANPPMSNDVDDIHSRTTTMSSNNQNNCTKILQIPKNVSNIPNLMEGGKDTVTRNDGRDGGAGYHLEQWQICMARDYAMEQILEVQCTTTI